ncbi:MAG: SufD family Fe-S cluster assembly protein [Saprospiraceae bacterium]
MLKNEAYQSTKNILLSDFAKMNMNPFLEIYADDIKCSPWCSLGDIDEDALFYLQSRGINKRKKLKILLKCIFK